MMKQGDPKKELWGVIQSNPDTKDLFVDKADFDSLLTADPKGVYSAIESTGMFVDYSDFEGVMGLKKKEPSEPVSPTGSEAAPTPSKAERPVFKSFKEKPTEQETKFPSLKDGLPKTAQELFEEQELTPAATQKKEKEVVTELPVSGKPAPRFISEQEEARLVGDEGMKAGEKRTFDQELASTQGKQQALTQISQTKEQIEESAPGIDNYAKLYEQAQEIAANESNFKKKLEFGDVATIQAYAPGGRLSQNIEEQRKQKETMLSQHEERLKIKNSAADKAAQQASKQIESIARTEIERNPEAFKELDATKSFDVVNSAKIEELADKIASDAGMATDSNFRRLAYNVIKQNAEYNLIKKDTEAAYEKAAKDILQKYQQEYEKGFKTPEEERKRIESEMAAFEATLLDDQKQEINPLETQYKEFSTSIQDQWKLISAQIDSQLQGLNKAYEQGAINQTDYTTQFNQIQSQAESELQQVNTTLDSAYNQYVKEINDVNTRYTRKYKQEANRLESIANQRIAEAQKEYEAKYGKNPELQAQLEAAYKAAYNLAAETRKVKIDVSERDLAAEGIKAYGIVPLGSVAVFSKQMLNGMGGVMKGWGQSIGSVGLEDFGNYMETKFIGGEVKSENWVDLIDPVNVVRSTGQLIGSMGPSTLATAATAYVSGGASVMGRLAASGAVGWAAETADIAGRAYLDEFEKNGGNVALAEDARRKSIESQVILAPAYALEGLPFIKGILSRVPTKVGRIATGAAIELGTEFIQEYPQNIASENIARGLDPFDNFLEQALNAKNAKETFISIAPVAILGGAGQITSKSRKQMLADYMSAQFTKQNVSDVFTDQYNQYIQNLVFNEGQKTANAVATMMYSGGVLNDAQYAEMTLQIESTLKYNEAADAAGISKSDKKVYGFFASRADQARKAAEQSNDPILSKVYEKQAQEYEKDGAAFLSGEKPNVLRIQYKDGSEFLMTPQEAKTLLGMKKFADEVKNGNISVSAFNEEGQTIIEEYKQGKYDKKDEQGIPSGVREGEAPVSEQPVEGAGAEAVEAGGILQAPVEVELEPTVAEASSDTKTKRKTELEKIEFNEDAKLILEAAKEKGEDRYYRELRNQASKTQEGRRLLDRHKAEDIISNPNSTLAERVAAKAHLQNDSYPMTDASVSDVQKDINNELSTVGKGEGKPYWNDRLRELKKIYDSELSQSPVTETQIPTDEAAPSTDNAPIGEVRLPDSGLEGKREGDAVQSAVDGGADTGDADALRDVESTAKAASSEVVSKKPEKIDMTQPRVEDVNISPRKKKAEELRAKAEAIRNATKGTAMVAPKAYAAALDAFATILETVDDIAEALKKWRETDEYKALADADRSEIESEMGADLGNDYVPPTPPKKEEPKKEGPKPGVKKVLVGRAYKGFAEEEIKNELERIGLTRQIQSHEQAAAAGQEFIDSVGIDNAIDLILDGTIKGAPAAYIFAKAIDAINTEVASEKDPARVDALSRKGAELLNAFGEVGTVAGQFNSMLAWVYANSDLGYSFEKKAAEYRAANNGVLPEDVEKKFREYEQKLIELEGKIKDADEREKRMAAQEAVTDIQEDIQRKKATKPSAKEAAKKMANQIRKAKVNRPNVFMSATPGAIVWDTAVEAVATAIEGGALLADAIEKGVNIIHKSAWYRGLSTDKQLEAEVAFDDFVKSKSKPEKGVEVIDGRIRVPANVVRELVESGVTDVDSLVAEVQKRIPEGEGPFTDREVRDAITGYGKRVNPRKDQIEREVNELKSVGRFLSQIEDLNNGIRKEKNPEKKAKMSEKVKALRREANALSRGLITEAEKVEAAKERVKAQINELNRRIKEKDFSKKKRPDPIMGDSELKRLLRDKQKVKELFDIEIHKAELKNRTFWQKVGDAAIEIWGLPRALIATGEMSFILIQGLVQTVSHPINAARALRKSIEHFSSEKRAAEWSDFVKSQPYYDTMKLSKLSLSEFDARLSAREEQFLGGWVNYIWDYAGFPIKFASPKAYEMWKRANLFKALERAGVGYLNTIRILRFVDGMQMLEKQGKTPARNLQSYKDLADVINTFTGRSDLPKPLQGMSRPLAAIFFSPKNWVSIIKQTTPVGFFWLGRMTEKGMRPSVAQKVALRDYMTYVTLTTSMVAMIASCLNDDDDEETGVELDPRSSDFMKIRLGDTRIDPWGGRAQMIVYQSRFIMNSVKTTTAGEVRKLGETPVDPTRAELTWNLVKNKLAPSASLAVKFLESKERDGELVDSHGNLLAFDEELMNVYPMYWSTVAEIYKEDPELVKHFLVAYGFLGGGISTYGTPEDVKEREKTKLWFKFKRENGREPNTIEMGQLEETAIKNAEDKIAMDKQKRSVNEKFNPELSKIDVDIKNGMSDYDAVFKNVFSKDWFNDLSPAGQDYVAGQLKRKYYLPQIED